jgi:hypothetical protein
MALMVVMAFPMLSKPPHNQILSPHQKIYAPNPFFITDN